jgi:murein DD-endopeptidase MepM/ murein hydrolase activator NlpD
MAVRGRHRRYQPGRINRASLTVTAGGAGLAIPLIGATTAHAADLDTWNKVAACESSGNWSVNTGNGYFGGLQFSQSTWEAYGGRAYAARADQAGKDQQVAVAEKVLKSQGPRAWPACSEHAGLTPGGQAPDISPASSTHPKAGGQTSTRSPGQAGRPTADVRPQTTPQARAGTAETYKVVRGDTLSGIAEKRGVDGGWQQLYTANRKVIGTDPDLILPGQRLGLEGSSTAARPPASKRTTPQPPAPKTSKPRTSAPETPAETEQPAKSGTQEKAGQQQGTTGKQDSPSSKASKVPKPTAKPHHKAPHPTTGLIAPVSAPIGTPYHETGNSWSKGYHTGVDFLVPTGTSVKAMASGQVVAAGWGGSYGYQVVIRHADGKYSQYAHLSAISVKSGQQVTGGQRLGRSGATGNVTGPHLHFEVRTRPGFGSDINPLAYLRAGGVTI